MEDVREERAIHTEDFVPKSSATGVPTGSYVFVIYEGTARVLDYKYNPEKDVNGNAAELYTEVMQTALEPVQELNDCKVIRIMSEDKNAPPFKMIMF